jgi:hypothetical protein
MEFIRTSKGKDIKVILPLAEYEKMQKKIKLLDKLEKLKITTDDLVDLALVRKTRGEKSIPLQEYLKNES